MESGNKKLVIATRESPLAMWQANHVKSELERIHEGLRVELLGMTTRGDRILDRSLSKIGGKGLFIKELERALLDGEADVAVHSMKDVPMELDERFSLAVTTGREDPRDALVSSKYGSLDELPPGAKVGTSSLRREAQLRDLRPDLQVLPLRGNVQTRLRKLDEGQFDAILLACAGLDRLGLADRIRQRLDPWKFVPAPGQAALGIEILASRTDLLDLLAPLNDEKTQWEVRAEREFSRFFGGSCQLPLAAFCRKDDPPGFMHMKVMISDPGGQEMYRSESVVAPLDQPEACAIRMANDMDLEKVGKLVRAVQADQSV